MTTSYGAAPAADLGTDEDFEGPAYRFLRFHHPNSSNAAYVISDLGPGVKLGTPLVCQRLPELDKDGKPVLIEEGEREGQVKLIPHHINAGKCRFMVLTVTQYWAAKPTTMPYDPVGTWTTKQDFTATYKGCKVKEAYIAQVLIFTPDGPELALCEVIGPKSKWLRQAIKAQLSAGEKQFVKENPELAKATKGAPGLRISGEFVVKPKSGDFGPWCYVEGEYDVISEEELNAFFEWVNDPDTEAEREDIGNLYASKVKDMLELAEKTPAL